MNIVLTERLRTAAELVRQNRKTVDVGTDHGYLPAFLVINGITEDATAADIGKGPLDNAKKTLEKYSLGDKIATVLSDGLEKIDRDTEEIIICGMGGTLIAEILGKAEWIKNEKIHLILQPMTHSQDVRKFLCENGFYIDTEKFCTDSGRDYVVISAYYNGEDNCRDDFYYYFGDTVTENTPSERGYLIRQTGYIKSRFRGLVMSESPDARVFAGMLDRVMQKWTDIWSEIYENS